MCVDLLKRSKTCTLASIYISPLLLGGLTTHCHISIILLLMRLCFIKKQGGRPLCQAWSNEARHHGGCNLGRQAVYLQHHGHEEGDVQTLVMRVSPSWVFVSSC